MNEIPAPQNVQEPPLPAPNPPAPVIPAPPAPAPAPAPSPAPGAPPPAADLVNRGVVKSERELELERKLVEREREVAELEDDLNALTQPASDPATPPTPKPKKVKRARFGCVAFRSDDGDE